MAIQWQRDKTVIGALVVLVVMLVAMLAGGPTGQILFSYATIAIFGIYILLGVEGTAKRHSYRPFLAVVGVVALILGVGFALLWHFHFANPSYTDPVYWLGFPRATSVLVYVLWMPPALVLMFAYPYLFEKYIWSAEEAEEFRQMDGPDATEGGEP
ncbi:hypothetical protein [Haloplanus pelagicus]|jgi:amino acid transporter|uniref:hypothetical protein n=1 Tax=Haloplanus pelagicus TaxID=2949995 RepID=UPI00203AE636|nr:hypothetical protein [Haloplanus sp. HW8-1]